LGEAVREALYMRQWLGIYYSCSEKEKCISIRCDNKGAIELSDHATDHNRTKHIDIKHHFVRDHMHQKEVKVTYVETTKQLADILTKCVAPQIFKRLNTVIYSGNCHHITD
jgi:hypothetical protein